MWEVSGDTGTADQTVLDDQRRGKGTGSTMKKRKREGENKERKGNHPKSRIMGRRGWKKRECNRSLKPRGGKRKRMIVEWKCSLKASLRYNLSGCERAPVTGIRGAKKKKKPRLSVVQLVQAVDPTSFPPRNAPNHELPNGKGLAPWAQACHCSVHVRTAPQGGTYREL